MNQTFDRHVRLESFNVQLGLNDRRPAPAAVPIVGSPPVATMPAGETFQLDFLWRSLQDHPGIFIVNATLDDPQGFRWATREVEPVDRMYPSWMWSENEVIRDQIRLEVPPEVPPGKYVLNVKLFDRGRPLTVLGTDGRPTGTQAKLIDVEVTRSDSQARAREVKIAERKEQKLTDDLAIIGNNLGDSEVSAGGELELALIWHAIRDVPEEFRARLRIVGDGNRVAGELVVPPTGEGNPTGTWERNDIFRGQYRIPIDREARAGNARLIVELLPPGSDESVGRVDIGRVTVKGR
jgi:hypothetical protein